MYRVNIRENILRKHWKNRNDIATTIVFQKVAIFGVQSKVQIRESRENDCIECSFWKLWDENPIVMNVRIIVVANVSANQMFVYSSKQNDGRKLQKNLKNLGGISRKKFKAKFALKKTSLHKFHQKHVKMCKLSLNCKS